MASQNNLLPPSRPQCFSYEPKSEWPRRPFGRPAHLLHGGSMTSVAPRRSRTEGFYHEGRKAGGRMPARGVPWGVEGLERRRLLSTATLTSGHLTITGDATADVIFVQVSGANLTVTDTTDSPSQIYSGTASAVTSIAVNA